jgi:hypothetical protein
LFSKWWKKAASFVINWTSSVFLKNAIKFCWYQALTSFWPPNFEQLPLRVIVQQMVEESCKFCYQLDFQRFPEKCIQNLLVSGFDLILTTGLRTITP